jgi:hypothetical protein
MPACVQGTTVEIVYAWEGLYESLAKAAHAIRIALSSLAMAGCENASQGKITRDGRRPGRQ